MPFRFPPRFLFAAVAVLALGCAGLSIRPDRITNVDAETAAALIKRTDIVIMDIRPFEDYAVGHIPGARLSSTLAHFSEEDGAVLVYDADGRRSFVACLRLKQQGVFEVYNLIGGFAAWQAANYPVETLSRVARR